MNADFGTNAQSYKPKRVLYEGTNTIRIGMALCYNHDTTSNILGYDKGNNVKGTTTAEGYQNEGKWKRVEEPSAANQRFFAGVVASAKEENQAGSGASWVDIYEPNGAIVAVYTDVSVTIGDAMYLEPGENTLTNVAVAGGVQVGWFVETVDRSGTAGLALAKLMHPEMGTYVAAQTLGIGLSPLLWGDAPVSQPGTPTSGVDYFRDFQDEVDVTTGDGWTLTQSNSTGVIAVEAVAPGGVLQVNSAGAQADDSINAQLKNVAVLPAAGTNIWCEMRLKIGDATQQWFAGLAAVDTTLMASGAIDDASDKCGFFHQAASTDDKVSSITARTTADDATADVADVTDDTYMTVGFKITGLTSVEFYVNGVLVETGVTAANIPNAAMCLSFFAGYEDAAALLSVDWIKIVASAGRDA
jgi:hypothetical protein